MMRDEIFTFKRLKVVSIDGKTHGDATCMGSLEHHKGIGALNPQFWGPKTVTGTHLSI